MSDFSLLELACLSIGIEPTNFPVEEVLALRKMRAEPLPSIKFFLDRLEQLGREFGHSYSGNTISPARFISWAEHVEFEVHPDFLSRLKKYANRPSPFAPVLPAAPAGKTDPREVDSVAMLFTAMAFKALGYRPKEARSPTPKEIVEHAVELGIKVSEDTVRKYLRIGAKFLSEEHKASLIRGSKKGKNERKTTNG